VCVGMRRTLNRRSSNSKALRSWLHIFMIFSVWMKLVLLQFFVNIMSGFHHDVNEMYAVSRFYMAWNGSSVLTFRDNLLVPSSRVKRSKKNEHLSIALMQTGSLFLIFSPLITHTFVRFLFDIMIHCNSTFA
jgi:membrane-anchored protein YejM (alkaline phosphatase superfamily)